VGGGLDSGRRDRPLCCGVSLEVTFSCGCRVPLLSLSCLHGAGGAAGRQKRVACSLPAKFSAARHAMKIRMTRRLAAHLLPLLLTSVFSTPPVALSIRKALSLAAFMRQRAYRCCYARARENCTIFLRFSAAACRPSHCLPHIFSARTSFYLPVL